MKKKLSAFIAVLLVISIALSGCNFITETINAGKSLLSSGTQAAKPLIDISVASSRGKDTLSDEQKENYDLLVSAMAAQQTEVILSGKNSEDDISKLINLVLLDHPILFDIKQSYTYSMTITGVKISIQYTSEPSEYVSLVNAALNAADSVISAAQKLPSEYKKLLYIHDYLAESIVYSDKEKDISSMYSALITKKTACEGYARAFQYLALACGIDTSIVYGNAGEDSIGHAWNMVWIDGTPYHTDVTWDDMLLDNGTAYTAHDYFLTTDNIIKKTHSISAEYNFIEIPQCIKDDMTFFSHEDMLSQLGTLNECKKLFRTACKYAKDNSKLYIQIAFANSEVYGKVANGIFKDGSLDNAVSVIGKGYGLTFSNKVADENTLVITYFK